MTDGQQTESEKMLDQIEAIKAQEPANTPSSAQSTEEAPSQTSEDKTAVADKGTQAVSDVVEKAPTEKVDKPEDDVKEWAKKKGIKDHDSALRSLRELERKMHKDKFEERRNVPRGTFEQQAPAPQWQPQPQYQPTPSFAPNPLDRERIIEIEAAKRGWDKGDFEKVLDLSTDIAAMQTRRLKAEFDSQLSEIKKETRRNSELNELSQDPYFRDKRVQFEMHKVLEENPQAFAHEPMPYRYAFDEAQRRLARKYLQDGKGEEEVRSSLPTEPPKDSSKGSSPSFERSKDSSALDNFNKAKTADEMRKTLTTLGAIQSH